MTDWYCQNSSSNINAAANWDDNPAGGGTDLTWGNQAAGDNFYANGKTAIAVNADPGPNGTVTLRTDAGAGTTGGGFTYATAANLTLNINRIAGSTHCLVISGSTGGGTLIGTSLGGSGTTYGTSDTHTSVTITQTGNCTGGSNTSAHGYGFSGATGSVTVNGNAIADVGNGINAAAAGTMTLNGDAIGSDTTTTCRGAFGKITITGSIIDGAAGSGAGGTIRWEPSSAQKYIKFNGGGTVIYASAGLGSDAGGTQITGANTAAKVATGTYFVKKDDGVYTQGTASSGGGGAWAQ